MSKETYFRCKSRLQFLFASFYVPDGYSRTTTPSIRLLVTREVGGGIISQFCGKTAQEVAVMDGVSVFCFGLCPGFSREKSFMSTGPSPPGDVSERELLRSGSCCGSDYVWGPKANGLEPIHHVVIKMETGILRQARWFLFSCMFSTSQATVAENETPK